MELKKNKLIIFFLIQILFNSFVKSTSPQCTIKLSCDENCSGLILKNGVTGYETSFSLDINNPTTTINYSQYYKIFDCQPGDIIIFSSTNTNHENGGIVCNLNVADSGTYSISIESSLTNYFGCSSCSINADKTLKLYDSNEEKNILEFSGIGTVQFTIEIPNEFNIKDNNKIYENILNSGYTFNFGSHLEPKLTDADTTNRLKIKIIDLPSDLNAILKKSDDTQIQLYDTLQLSDNILFKPSNQANYGLFSVKCKVVKILSETDSEITLKFNICYKYCNTCENYDNGLSSDYKCLTCITNTYFVNSDDTIDKRCYDEREKEELFSNYYLNTAIGKYDKCNEACSRCSGSADYCISCNNDNLYYRIEGQDEHTCFIETYINSHYSNYYLYSTDNIYKQCHLSCSRCSGSADHCEECSNNYYFVENEDPNKCFHLDEIEILPNKYYLFNSPSGHTYKLCQDNCNDCILNPTNCLSCKEHFYFIENKANTECLSDSSLTNENYFISEDGSTYILGDESCSSYNYNKKKCVNCKDNYYKVRGKGDYCFLPEEIYYYFGKNYYKSTSTTPNIYESCDISCDTCIGSSTNCLKCNESDDYYFYESPTDDFICKLKNEIESIQNPYYFLPKGSDTYYQCNTNCKECKFTSTYCTSCKDGFYMIENENKCTNTIENSYYLDNDNIIKKCPHSCSKCALLDGSIKCDKCISPYFLVEDLGECITLKDKIDNSKYSHYFLETRTISEEEIKIFSQCDVSCKTCENSKFNCIECSNNYLFYEDGEKKCIINTERVISSNNYYYNENLKELRKCHKSCISCKDGNVNYNCYQCSSNYVFIDDPNNGLCVLKTLFSSKLKNYYKITINNHRIRGNVEIIVDVYKKCNEFCKECDSDPMQCLKCNEDKGYYKHTDPINDNELAVCYSDSIIEHKYYYYNSVYLPSREKCLLSDYESHIKDRCLKCHNKLGYYSLEQAEETCDNYIPLDHYIYNNQIIKKCAYECASCSEGPTESSTNCDICKEEYPPSASNPKNCIFKCPFYYYEYFGNKYCTGEKECPSLAPNLIPDELKCVEKCPKFTYYGICYDACPESTFLYNTVDNICRANYNSCSLSKFENIREHLIDLKEDNTSIQKKVKKYIDNFDYTINHIDQYKHYLDEYTMYIYQNYQCINSLLPTEISVDFSNCGFNNINDYIIVLLVIQREDKYPNIFYQIYNKYLDSNSNPILITNYYCTQVHVEIPASQANFGIDKYHELYNKGIDLTKYGDNFFYDICYQYYHDGKDVVIEQRRKEYFQDPYKICKDGCYFTTPDFTYERAVCACNSKSSNFLYDLNDENDNNNNYIIHSSYYDTNTFVFENLKCFPKNFEEFFIFLNMGSYVMIFVVLVEIFSIMWYSYNGIMSINSFVVDLVKKNPPKRVNKTENDINKVNNGENDYDINNGGVNNVNIIKNKVRKKTNKKINDNYLSKLDKPNIILDNFDKKTKYKDNDDVLISRANNFRKLKTQRSIDIDPNQKYDTETINKLKILSNINTSNNQLNIYKNNNTQFDKYYHEFTDYELNSMELYDAILKDKRTFCYFFKLQMKLKQEFYKAFCYYVPLYPYAIKTMAYFFGLALNFVFNALLYTEKQIYEGVLKKSKNISNIFLRGFYAFLIVECIMFLIHCILKNANYLKSLVYRVKKEKQLRVEAYKSIQNIRINYRVFICIVIIFEILFWIYLSSYCYCYHGEQLELFLGFLVTQFFIEIFCIPFALYLTIFRFVGIKWKLTTCYKLSQAYLDN